MEPELAKKLHSFRSITFASELFVTNDNVADNPKPMEIIGGKDLRMTDGAILSVNQLEGEMRRARTVKIAETCLQLLHGQWESQIGVKLKKQPGRGEPGDKPGRVGKGKIFKRDNVILHHLFSSI